MLVSRASSPARDSLPPVSPNRRKKPFTTAARDVQSARCRAGTSDRRTAPQPAASPRFLPPRHQKDPLEHPGRSSAVEKQRRASPPTQAATHLPKLFTLDSYDAAGVGPLRADVSHSIKHVDASRDPKPRVGDPEDDSAEGQECGV